ncbi:PH domain-containing protein [Lysobacter sp. KIS68-7]|uniref:PH domain-containing protein n=1 Tax=Lysobacter sp. KIS68-7 TaxID=2904252 RepID=UPI001E64F7CD|nr:PH domain-containing protein [Lysobacter sp. KIS68-7]UHQ20304.1 PH domain-containing protein [Lysobacter sp. KIS68-7]
MTPSEAADRRLHPWSWVFVLLQQMKQYVVPLVAAFFFGGDRNELWPLIGVGVLALISVMQYFTYRYAVGRDGLTIRSGWLHRQRREIPYARIHNVSVEQSLLHRFFGVAELRLESASGRKPEATMRVLKLDDALALERLVRHRGAAETTSTDAQAPAADAPQVLLAMSPGEVMRLGLVSNRGMVVLAAAYGGSFQFSPGLTERIFQTWGSRVFGWAGEHHFGSTEYVLAGITLALAFLAAMRLLSMGLALLQYFGFTLTEQAQRLTVDRGLLARVRSSASRRRLQAWTLHEGLMHRLLKRRSLHVDTAGGGDSQSQQKRSLRELAPIATPEQCDALIEHLLPGAGWSTLPWRGTHPRSALRAFLPNTVFPVLLCAGLCWRFGSIGLLALLLLPWFAFTAWHHAKHARYAVDERLVAVRGGWWSRHWRFAEVDKLQAVRLSQGPLDRRWGMATLWLDTAGASATAPSLRINHLPEADARVLLDRLAHTLASRKLRW